MMTIGCPDNNKLTGICILSYSENLMAATQCKIITLDTHTMYT